MEADTVRTCRGPELLHIHDFAGGLRGMRAAWVCEEMSMAYAKREVADPPSEAYRRAEGARGGGS